MYARSSFGGIWGSPSGSPLTIGIICTVAALYIAGLAGASVGQWLAFFAGGFPARFWTPLTWFLVPEGGNPLSLLFAFGWFYLFAGSLERAWGTRDFGTILVALSVTMAMLCWAGGFAMNGAGALAGLSAITGPLMVAWAIVNKHEVLQFFFLPITAPIMGWIGVAMTWYYGGGGLGGLFLLPACAAMYWYVTQGRYAHTQYDRNRNPRLRFDEDDTPPRYGNRSGHSLEDATPVRFNLFRWWRVRQEKKRLEDIFRRSGFTDEDERR